MSEPLGTSQVLSERLREMSKNPAVAAVEGLAHELSWAADKAQGFEDVNRQFQISALDIRHACQRASADQFKANDTDMPTAIMVSATIGLVQDAFRRLPKLGLWNRVKMAARLLLGRPLA